jgi:hypothetical protein
MAIVYNCTRWYLVRKALAPIALWALIAFAGLVFLHCVQDMVEYEKWGKWGQGQYFGKMCGVVVLASTSLRRRRGTGG